MTHEEGEELTGTDNEELVLEFITAGETAVTEIATVLLRDKTLDTRSHEMTCAYVVCMCRTSRSTETFITVIRRIGGVWFMENRKVCRVGSDD